MSRLLQRGAAHGNVIHLEEGLAFAPIRCSEFDELLRVIRVDHRKHLERRTIDRPGIQITVYLVNGDPVAAHQRVWQGDQQTWYRRMT